MTTIKATCPSCGEVGLAPEEIELRVDSSDAAASFYAFACPSCRDTIRKPADQRVVRLLMSGGVAVRPAEQPAPPRRRLAERFEGRALTHDDLLDFHTLLAREDWFDALLRCAPRTRAA